MHVGTRHPIWQVIHESLHTRGSGLNTQATTTLIGSDRSQRSGRPGLCRCAANVSTCAIIAPSLQTYAWR